MLSNKYIKNKTIKIWGATGFQRITGYITPGYFNEKIGYITPGYFKEEPGISPLDISMKNRVYHPQIFQ
jgi:hypothetical protein